MKTLQNAKDKIAEKHGYSSWKAFVMNEIKNYATTTFWGFIDEAAELYATSQIEELTKEVERLKKEQEHYIQFTNEEIEKFREAYRKECVKNSDLKSSNDRYREALEEKQSDLTGCTQLLNEMFAWAKVKNGRAFFETSEETWNGYKKYVSSIHPLVKEGE